MSARRRRTGRVRVAFTAIEQIAATAIAADAFAEAMTETDWKLTRHSALHRCKDGSYTLCLIWHAAGGGTLTKTMRGIRLEEA